MGKPKGKNKQQSDSKQVPNPAPNAFEDFYAERFGPRWSDIRQALLLPTSIWGRPNAFASELGHFLPGEAMARATNGLLQHYPMDPASYLSARALMVEPEHYVLDLCAAPGGKTLILAEKCLPHGSLIANEISSSRRERLTSVLRQYIPSEVRQNLRVTGQDGGRLVRHHPASFDRILLDAPCSGERHWIDSSERRSEWKFSHVKALQQRQYALLTAALLMAKTSALIVYSTCALLDEENDHVIARTLQKKASFSVTPPAALAQQLAPLAGPFAGLNLELTVHGVRILPSAGANYGPMYISRLLAN